ncbi:MAG: hypothetical protein ACFFAY_09860 [Promethearchaeota archaeon]
MTITIYSDDDRILSGFFVDILQDVRNHIQILEERLCPIATCAKCGANIDLRKVGEERIFVCDYCGAMGRTSLWQ